MNDSPLMEQARRFIGALRHCQVLDMRVESIDAEGVTLLLPYSPRIVGNPQTGVIHGGALTSLMDTTCGMATLCVLPTFEVCPTLDLRIDYMHPAQPHKDLHGFARCYRVTRDVIFVRGHAYQDNPDEPVAHVVGTFMRLGKAIKGAQAFAGSLKGGTAMISEALREQVRQAHLNDDFAELLKIIPYAGLIGIQCQREGDSLLFRLPANPDNIGNPLLPAIHGGVIAGFMELAAALHLILFTHTGQVPKIIDFSIDYLRAGLALDTYAQCRLWRQGRRVTNVAITAWQADRDEPIATARAHFKIDETSSP